MEKTTKAEKSTIFFVKKISPYISGVNLTSPRSKNLLCFFILLAIKISSPQLK